MTYGHGFVYALYPEMFGAVGDGSTDDSDAFNAMFAEAVARRGGIVQFNAGKNYHFASQVTCDLSVTSPTYNTQIRVFGTGAVITTSGAISALLFTGNTDVMGITLQDVYIDHDGNTSAIAGIELVGTTHARLENCTFVAGNGTSTGYIGLDVRNADPSDNDTGSFWTRVRDCTWNKFDNANMDIGLRLRGAANSTLLDGNNFAACNTAILITHEDDEGHDLYSLPSNVTIANTFLENVGTGVSIVGTSGHEIAEGFKLLYTQIDSSVTTLLSLSGATADSNTVPLMLGNTNSFGATHLSNSNDLTVMVLEPANVNIGVANNLPSYEGMIISSGDSGVQALRLNVSGGDRGIAVYDISGNLKGRVVRDPLTGVAFGIDGGGNQFSIFNLPTSNPHVVGALWNSGGTVLVSSG